jgi:hypothetical protein
MKRIYWFVTLLFLLFTLSAFADEGVPSDFDTLNLFQKTLVIICSLVSAIVLPIICWITFPYTLAPLTIILRSPLGLLGNRIALTCGSSLLGFIFTFLILSKTMSDPIRKIELYERQYQKIKISDE